LPFLDSLDCEVLLELSFLFRDLSDCTLIVLGNWFLEIVCCC
jgi:hypothetical protein